MRNYYIKVFFNSLFQKPLDQNSRCNGRNVHCRNRIDSNRNRGRNRNLKPWVESPILVIILCFTILLSLPNRSQDLNLDNLPSVTKLSKV